MIEEISTIQADATLFPGRQLQMVLASIAAGNTSGRLWRVTDEDGSALYMLWDRGNNVFYFAGHPSLATVPALATLLRTKIRHTAIRQRLVYFKVHALSAALEDALPELFGDLHLHETHKLFYRFDKPTAPTLSAAIDGVRYQRIDAAFLAQQQYANIDAVKNEVDWMWSSPAAYQAHGFGSVALVGDALVCWCTAEYVSERLCGIGIETVNTFQNKGIASATAAHFVNECLQRNLTPHWECDRQNVGSMRVAQKVGFELDTETVFWSGRFA